MSTNLLFGLGTPRKVLPGRNNKCGQLAHASVGAKTPAEKELASDAYINGGCHHVNSKVTYPLLISQADLTKLEFLKEAAVAIWNTAEDADLRTRAKGVEAAVVAIIRNKHDAGGPEARQALVTDARKLLGQLNYIDVQLLIDSYGVEGDKQWNEEPKQEEQEKSPTTSAAEPELEPLASPKSPDQSTESQEVPKSPTELPTNPEPSNGAEKSPASEPTAAGAVKQKQSKRKNKKSSEVEPCQSPSSVEPASAASEAGQTSTNISNSTPTVENGSETEQQDRHGALMKRFLPLPGEQESWVDPRTSELLVKPIERKWIDLDTGEAVTDRALEEIMQEEYGFPPAFGIHDKDSAEWYLKLQLQLQQRIDAKKQELEIVQAQLQKEVQKAERKLSNLQRRFDWELKSWAQHQLPRDKDGNLRGKTLVTKYCTISFEKTEDKIQAVDRYKVEKALLALKPAQRTAYGATTETKEVVKFSLEDVTSAMQDIDELGEGLFKRLVGSETGIMRVSLELDKNKKKSVDSQDQPV